MVAKKDVSDPAVIIDFIFCNGLLFVEIKNISSRPVYEVTVDFDPDFSGVGGAKLVSKLQLFKELRFLAPNKSIRVFLDTSDSYFKRGQPTLILAAIAYRYFDGKRETHVIKHDLSIYEEIGYINRLDSDCRSDGKDCSDEFT